MHMRVGCEFRYQVEGTTPGVMLVQPHPQATHRIVREVLSGEPTVALHEYRDGFGNRCQRFVLPAGPAVLRYDALVALSDGPDPADAGTVQEPVEELPDEVLVFTLPSRYCLSDALANDAWRLFGDVPPGWARLQAVCDWIQGNIQYGVPSTPLTTALETYERRGGVCRDFAHLAVTFCRALSIPARYVFGYIPDLDIPPPHSPMDFHAWFEAYMGGRWWTLDARFNRPMRGRVPIARGRDAVDVAMMTTYGAARLEQMIVWSDVADGASTESPSGALISASEASLGQG